MTTTSPIGETDNETNQSRVTDIFASLDALRMDPTMTDSLAVTKALVTIPVRKPSKETFVRTHPDADNYAIDTMVLELKEDSEIFLVTPALRESLATESTVHIKRLWLAYTRQGDHFIWPVRLPGADGKLDTWNESALEAQKLGTEKWVRVTANRHLGAYNIDVAKLDQQPEWSERPYNELLAIAFKGKVIDTWDHPVLRRLRGEL